MKICKKKPAWKVINYPMLKILMIMKLTACLFLVSTLSVMANLSYAQSTKLTFEFKNTPLEEVLSVIEDNSEFYFLYSKRVVDVERKVDISVKDETVPKILDILLANSNEIYIIRDRQIVLTVPGDPWSPSSSYYRAEKIQFQRTVSGKVTDKQNQPLPGVTIVVKGTTQGTVTDADGEYTITDLPAEATLIFSFVGMQTQEIVVGSQTSINVVMETDVIGIEEVVAVGYGTMRKSDLTGSVIKVNTDKLAELPNISIMQSMQGTVPGLNVGAINQAGQNPAISIRGQNTISSSSSENAPLIVLDGIIYNGSIIDLNTDDIESIDILKDASSASIYGSRSANGVIIITTKKGNIGKPIINYSGSYTIQVPSNEIKPMGREEHISFLKDAFWADGSRIPPDYLQENPDFSLSAHLKTPEISRGFEEGVDNDWWGMFTGNGYINNQNISVSGRSNSLNYYFSIGLADVKGFIKNDTYNKYNYGVNIDAKINEWINVGIESFLTTSDYSGVSPSINRIFYLQPFTPIYHEDGSLILQPDGGLTPFAEIDVEDSDKRLNIFSTLYADIKVPFIKGLNYRINFSQNYRTRNHDEFNPYGANFKGSGYKNSSINYDYTFDNIISYINKLGEIHDINATLVYGVDKRQISYTNSSAQSFNNFELGYNSLQEGDPTLFSIATGAEKETSLYMMGRAIYNLMNKYIMTGTVRRDGFSGFGTEKKIGIFPSGAIAWIISKENLIKNNLNWIDFFKIRGSYGTTARRALRRYDTKSKMGTAPSIVFGDGGSTTMGQWISTMANNELGWETTTGLNLGLDFVFFDSRISGNFEYYINDTRDILYPIQLPSMTGFSSINTNIGKVHNHGIEFSLTGRILKSNKLNWEATVNFSRNRNEIVSILGPDNDQDGDGREDDLPANRLFIGEPRNVQYNYEIIGMWQLEDDIPSGFYPGTYKIADLNDDGKYSAADDRKILGYIDPSYRFSIVNNLNYKRFNLYIFLNSIQGGKNYYYGNDSPPYGAWGWVQRASWHNAPTGAWDYWVPENPDAKYPSMNKEPNYLAVRYSQRNFIRLQDVSLSYEFDKNLLGIFSDIGNLKVFISGKNLVTITKWAGGDPEVGSNYIDYPLMTNYTVGINVKF